MTEEQEANKKIDEFLSKREPTSGEIAAKIGIAVFFAIIAAFVIREAYEQYKIAQYTRALKRTAQSFSRDLERINAQNQQRIRNANLESQRRMRKIQAENRAKAKERERQQYLNNYWKDIGNGTFINVGRSKRSGDLATALIKVHNRQSSVSVNCRNNTFWSEINNGWFPPASQASTEGEMIRTACKSNNKGRVYVE